MTDRSYLRRHAARESDSASQAAAAHNAMAPACLMGPAYFKLRASLAQFGRAEPSTAKTASALT